VYVSYSGGYNFDFQGEKAQRKESGPIAPDVQRIDIDNQFGDVRIEPAESGEARWAWELTCWAQTKAVAEELLQRIELQRDETADRVRWKLVLPQGPVPELRGVRSNLTLFVQPAAKVTVENRHGNVELARLEGEIEVANGHGGVALSNLSAMCKVSNEHGNTTAENIQGAHFSCRHGSLAVHTADGDLEIDSQHGSVEVRQVQGKLAIKNAHSRIDANDIAGRADLETAHAEMHVSGVQGGATLKNRHGLIQATEVNGPIDVENHHGGTNLSVHSAEVSCQSEHGTVHLVAKNPDVQTIRVRTAHGSIHAVLPASVTSPIEARAVHGEVESEFSMAEKPVPVEAESSGGRFEFETRHGNIRIEKGKNE
jgi:hypothetical protein